MVRNWLMISNNNNKLNNYFHFLQINQGTRGRNKIITIEKDEKTSFFSSLLSEQSFKFSSTWFLFWTNKWCKWILWKLPILSGGN